MHGRPEAEAATGLGPGRDTGGQEPPEVTWPEPELDDGAVVLLRPLERFEPELFELAEFALEDFEPELPELAEPELAEPVDVELDECCVVAARAEPGSVAPMAAAASTLPAPAASVTARSLDWCRFLAAIAARRSSLAGFVMAGPSGRLLADLQPGRRSSAEPLRRLGAACQAPPAAGRGRRHPCGLDADDAGSAPEKPDACASEH
jgi:hypothetical protein